MSSKTLLLAFSLFAISSTIALAEEGNTWWQEKKEPEAAKSAEPVKTAESKKTEVAKPAEPAKTEEKAEEKVVEVKKKKKSKKKDVELKQAEATTEHKEAKKQHEESAKEEKREIAQAAPVISTDAPLKFEFSGFATLEYEASKNYGYDAGDTSVSATSASNFTTNVTRPNRKTGSFFSNFNANAIKGDTSLNSIFEIGEIFFGDSNTGGNQGARKGTIIEVRNLYLMQKFNDQFSAKGGIITSITDPRSFIYNDHTSSVHANYNFGNLSVNAWFGVATKNRPAVATFSNDNFWSLQAAYTSPNSFKATTFYTKRKQANQTFAEEISTNTFRTRVGTADTHWLGETFEFSAWDPFKIEATFIGNWNKFYASTYTDSTATTYPNVQNTMFAYLADLKLSHTFRFGTFLSLEGLMTTGAASTTDTSGNKVLTRRKAFSSPVGAAYLMTVATNDGVDDAAGTPK